MTSTFRSDMDKREINKCIVQECLQCKVDGGCNVRDNNCGIKKGVKYGFYPESAFRAPVSNLDPAVVSQLTTGRCGYPEQPLWKNGEGISKLVKDIAKYTEDWMRHEKWETI